MKRNLIIAATLLLTACHPQPAGHSSPQPAPPLQTVNIADVGLLKVSGGDWIKQRAVDSKIDTWWSADDFAPQWIEIDLKAAHLVTKIEFAVSQVRAGPATHRLIAERNGETVVWHRFDIAQVTDGHLFSLKIHPPKIIDTVRVLTTRHEGWVAIRELRIMAPPPATVSIAASGLTEPVFLTHANDNSGRLFVVEKEGRIRIVEEGRVAATPFLDISAKVDTHLHNGLLGLAFSPAYASNDYFYVSYVSTDKQNRVSRFSVGSDPDIADPDSEETILEFHQPGSRHSVGTLSFGPLDGYLYIAVGDGKVSRLPDLAQDAQDPGKFLGKILRINVESGTRPYAIPPDNPFLSMPGYAPEIWALGLRNPWGIAFDQKTGGLYIPDTGQATTEEINWQAAHSGGGGRTTAGPSIKAKRF